MYTASPPGIGDNGNWTLLDTTHLPNVAGHNPAVPGSGEHIVSTRWQPAAGEHSCIKVAIFPQVGEIETNNNMAQEKARETDFWIMRRYPTGPSEKQIKLSSAEAIQQVDRVTSGICFGAGASR